jgi:hypothetical protein
VCGKSFATRQALGGHATSHTKEARENTHAIATAPPQSAFVSQLERARREIVAQFRPRIRELDGEIDRAKAKVAALTAERKDVEVQLRRLDPDAPKMGPKGTKNKSEADTRAAFTGNELDVAKLDATRAFLRDNGATLGAFTGQRLHHAMRDANVTPLGSSEKVRAFLPILRDEGMIRAHKTVKGGGMAYAVVGVRLNGDVPDAP